MVLPKSALAVSGQRTVALFEDDHVILLQQYLVVGVGQPDRSALAKLLVGNGIGVAQVEDVVVDRAARRCPGQVGV